MCRLNRVAEFHDARPLAIGSSAGSLFNLYRLAAIILTVFSNASCVGLSQEGIDCSPSVNDKLVSLVDKDAAAATIRALFEANRRLGLNSLESCQDPEIVLHVLWEQAKGDKNKTRQFIDSLDQKLRIVTPRWWQRCLLNVLVTDTFHYIPDVEMSRAGAHSIVYSDGEIIVDPSASGFSYSIRRTDMNRNRTVWSSSVWAVNRTALAGVGAHQVELVISDERVFVFGAESHGAYLEAFDLSDGRPLVRFCTCYWFNFSESWSLYRGPGTF